MLFLFLNCLSPKFHSIDIQKQTYFYISKILHGLFETHQITYFCNVIVFLLPTKFSIHC